MSGIEPQLLLPSKNSFTRAKKPELSGLVSLWLSALELLQQLALPAGQALGCLDIDPRDVPTEHPRLLAARGGGSLPPILCSRSWSRRGRQARGAAAGARVPRRRAGAGGQRPAADERHRVGTTGTTSWASSPDRQRLRELIIGRAPRSAVDDAAGAGSGINATFRQVGIATGIAALGALFQAR